MRKILTSIGLFYIILLCYQVVEYLQVDRYIIYKLVRSELILPIKIAGQWRFKKDLIDKWIEGGRLKNIKDSSKKK